MKESQGENEKGRRILVAFFVLCFSSFINQCVFLSHNISYPTKFCLLKFCSVFQIFKESWTCLFLSTIVSDVAYSYVFDFREVMYQIDVQKS